MQVVYNIEEMTELSRNFKREGKRIGFVPTMGCLHEGHLSLARKAKEETDIVILSIFVNPTQFLQGEDFDKYPRDEERDILLLEKEGVDILFMPSAIDMYPGEFTTKVDVAGGITGSLCASSRPGHFEGVSTIVLKLFNITAPNIAYFGQKDAQQAAVIKRMQKDLNLPVDIRIMPIVRESDGLAMSSRNTYLTGDERQQALSLYRSLEQAEIMIREGETSSERIAKEIKEILVNGAGVKVDYVAVVDQNSLLPVDDIRENTLIAIAAYVGKTRLIDNIVVSA